MKESTADKLAAWAAEHPDATGQEIADYFGVSVSTAFRQLRKAGWARSKGANRTAQRNDAVLQFITEYMDANVWAPSIEEIAEGTGISKSSAWAHVTKLRSAGIIEVGPLSRQIRFKENA